MNLLSLRVFATSLTIASAISAGLWFASMQRWTPLALGLGIMVLGQFIIQMMLAPQAMLARPSQLLSDRGHDFAASLARSLPLVYQWVVMFAWCSGVSWLFLSRADTASFLPSFIWSYTVALISWGLMPAAEGDTAASGVKPRALTQLGYLAIILYLIGGDAQVIDAAKVPFVAVGEAGSAAYSRIGTSCESAALPCWSDLPIGRFLRQ